MLTEFQKELINEIIEFKENYGSDLMLLRSVRKFSKQQKKEISQLIKKKVIIKKPEEVCKWIRPKLKIQYDTYSIVSLENI